MTAAGPKFKLTASRQFTAWLADQCVSLAFTTYQTGKLLLIGLRPDGRLSVFERTFAVTAALPERGRWRVPAVAVGELGAFLLLVEIIRNVFL